MLNDNSAAEREETPHTINSTQNKTLRPNQTIGVALKRRAQEVINDKSIDARSRTVIRYGLETNDPWLPELVRRAEAGKPIVVDTIAGNIFVA